MLRMPQPDARSGTFCLRCRGAIHVPHSSRGRHIYLNAGNERMSRTSNPDRRTVLAGFAASAAALGLPSTGFAQAGAPITRKIPSSGEAIPVVGLGTWITFNVGNDSVARDACAEVMRAFFAAGGRMIDSSPMYGSSQD